MVFARSMCKSCYLGGVNSGKVQPVGRGTADTGRASSSTQDAPDAEPEDVKPEIKEEVDTDEDDQTTPGVRNPLRTQKQQYEDDAAEMTRLEAEYDAYVSKRRNEMPNLQQVRTIGARMRKFAGPRNRTSSVPIRRK